MRLFETFSTKTTTTTMKPNFDYKVMKNKNSKDTEKHWRDFDKKTGKKFTYDTGSSSAVSNHPKDPHTVNKKNIETTDDLQNDGFYNYVKFIEPYADSNPYFLRVYNVYLRTDPSGSVRPKYNIEKLYHHKDFTPEELIHLGKRMFKDWDKFTSKMDTFDTYSVDKFISDELREVFEGQSVDTSNVKDPELKEAAIILSGIFKDSERNGEYQQRWFDMHTRNFLYRKTPYGPQVVISDPFI